ncbi:thermonuclease family protein [Thermoflavimicrobium dichotomicum]|uniref:Endonuclease YncB, thermonuclease family n=1 Tax=Thermoflavimicrobium dichotomicum TaxID=46223 RepID=A0A1I3NAQ0_9BACL|nr:thermonuclease family protein [Thermoflavimicrobium dichotomicum]SFJ06292.1 Endonuclease YncB, thermonuclease family [Thermoflavimicrobium dichotomicum]
MRGRWWKVWLSLLSVSSLLLILTSCTSKKPDSVNFSLDELSFTNSFSYTAYVEHVVDGDTIRLAQPVLGTKKVRLLSIDAPETDYYNIAQKWGKEARIFLEKLLPSGTRVTIRTDQVEKDNDGQLLAHVWKDGLDVNKEMLRGGYAVTHFIWPNISQFKAYQSAYLEAKKAGKGMWDPTNPISDLPFEFRIRVSGEEQDQYIGNFDVKKYVEPTEYKQIPVEKRLFFFTEEDAKKAGYSSCVNAGDS